MYILIFLVQTRNQKEIWDLFCHKLKILTFLKEQNFLRTDFQRFSIFRSSRVKYFKLNLYQARRELLAKVKLSSQRFKSEILFFIFSQSSVWTWGFWNKYRELWQVEFIISDVTVTLCHYDIDTPFLLDTGKFSFILENGRHWAVKFEWRSWSNMWWNIFEHHVKSPC